MLIIIDPRLVYNDQGLRPRPLSAAAPRLFRQRTVVVELPRAGFETVSAAGAYHGFHDEALKYGLPGSILNPAIISVDFDANKMPARHHTGDPCATRPHEWVKDGITGIG